MSATLPRPTRPTWPAGRPRTSPAVPAPPAGGLGPGQGGAPGDAPAPAWLREAALVLAVLVLLVAAVLPFARVFLGLAFLRPLLAAAVLAVGLPYGCRRLGGGPVVALLASLLGYAGFVGVAFLPDTLIAGVLPSTGTLEGVQQLWMRGVETIQLRPAPVFADASLLLITVTGMWAVAHTVEGFTFQLRAPLKAIASALVLWIVPLAVGVESSRPWAWAVPFLVASCLLLLTFAGADVGRFGRWVAPAGLRRGRQRPGRPMAAAGAVTAAVAITAGVLGADALPGYGEPPWYQIREQGGTTLTTNPIVGIRSQLVATDTGPVMRVRSTRPVYLRTTALDVYGENEEWTNSGIRGSRVAGALEPEAPIAAGITVDAVVEVQGLEPGSVLVPVPYQPELLDGPAAGKLQYDRNRATVTTGADATLDEGDRYAVRALVPAPDPELLRQVPAGLAPPELLQLPPGVPAEVGQLAREIVDARGATTPFEQALAVQDELRSWTYSVEPQLGHTGRAMLDFIINRVGYCEQYAGTMAVMLRTLGIPARVAVGYTPGTLVGPDTYSVSNANAHAWVEVLFPGAGWVAFEPTPRGDGNVLVPTAANLAPSLPVSAEQAPAEREITEQELLRQRNAGAAPVPTPSPTPAAATPPDVGGVGLRWPLLVLAALVLVGAALLATGRRRRASGPPAERIAAAVAAVVRVGRGMGTTPVPSDTDREHLGRLAGSHPRAGADVAALVDAVDRSRWASRVEAADADAAEAAADRVVAALLADLPPWRRAQVRLRGAAQEGAAVWTARLAGFRAGARGLQQRAAALVRRLATSRFGG